MNGTRNVMIGVDFSQSSTDALAQALRIAKLRSARVRAVHAIPPFVASPMIDPWVPPVYPPVGEILADEKARWGAMLKDAGAGVALPIHMEFAGARQMLLHEVHECRPDLLVVGARGEYHGGRTIGPTASACIEHADAKVLVVREGHRGPFRRIVVGIDFSETSRMALEEGIRWAALDDAELHILHVVQDPFAGGRRPREVTGLADVAGYLRESAQRRLDRFCEPLEPPLQALRAQRHVKQAASVPEGITGFVTAIGADLVVLGTRAMWNFHDFLWGSTAERVFRTAPCSLLAIKPAGFRQRAGVLDEERGALGADAAGNGAAAGGAPPERRTGACIPARVSVA